jgi:hypothetical protein
MTSRSASSFDPKGFKESIDLDLRAAEQSEDELEGNAFNSANGSYDDSTQDEERSFAHTLQRIYLKVSVGLELMQMPMLLTEFRDGWRKVVGRNSTRMEMNSTADFAYSPVLNYLRNYISALYAGFGVRDASQERTALLVQLLKQTGLMIHRDKILPRNEAEVRRALYVHLRYVFGDLVREIPIAKPSKTYKPDFGVKSLRSAIEYKFVDSETEAKRVLGEIYEDIHGYTGSEDWSEFYAVIYQTDLFLTEHVIDAEWDMSDVPQHWHPILVSGAGARTKKKRSRNAIR